MMIKAEEVPKTAGYWCALCNTPEATYVVSIETKEISFCRDCWWELRHVKISARVAGR